MFCSCDCHKPHVLDPNQRDLFYQAETQSRYKDGYASGVKWDANWMPGGPVIYYCCVPESDYRYPERKAREYKSIAEHQTWMDGFRDGLKVRLQEDKEYAEWFHATKNSEHGLKVYRPVDE